MNYFLLYQIKTDLHPKINNDTNNLQLVIDSLENELNVLTNTIKDGKMTY